MSHQITTLLTAEYFKARACARVIEKNAAYPCPEGHRDRRVPFPWLRRTWLGAAGRTVCPYHHPRLYPWSSPLGPCPTRSCAIPLPPDIYTITSVQVVHPWSCLWSPGPDRFTLGPGIACSHLAAACRLLHASASRLQDLGTARQTVATRVHAFRRPERRRTGELDLNPQLSASDAVSRSPAPP